MTKKLNIFCVVCLCYFNIASPFSWQTTDHSPSHPNSVINDAFGHSDVLSMSYDMTSAFLTDWPQWLMMHLPGFVVENNSTIDPGLMVDGSSQNSFLNTPYNWGFLINGISWQDPLSHAAQPWLSPTFSWIGINVIKPNVFFPQPSGTLWVDAHRGNTNYEKAFMFFFDSEGTQHYDLWLSQEHNPMGFSAWFKHDIAQGHRDNTDGHDSNLLLQFSTQTPRYTDHWSFQWYDSHANYNETIPLELYIVSPNAFYVSPNTIDQTAYRGQWQRLLLITDDKIYHLAMDAKIQHKDGQFTHPLDLGTTSCSDLGDVLCLSNKALVTSDNNTLTAANVGNPRSYALDSMTNNDSQSFLINQHIEIDQPLEHRFFGLNALFVDSDYVENHYLAQLNNKRAASDLTMSNNTIKLGGLKADNASSSALSSFSPVNATQKEMDFDLYGLERWTINSRTKLDVKASFHNTYYDTKDHRDNTGFTGDSVTNDKHYYRFNPSAGVTYQLNENAYVFSNIYQANMPPSPQLLACSNASSPCYWPSGFFQAGDLSQSVDHGFSLGYKQSDWHVVNGLSWGISGLWQLHSDDIIIVPTDWMQGYARNVDKTERLASNMDVHWMHDQWRLDANYQYQHAFYASNFTVEKAYDTGSQTVNSGDPMPGLPSHQLRLNLGYQWTPSISFKANWFAASSTEYYGNFTGEKSSQESNQWELTDIPGYGIFGVSMTWRPTYQITMQFNVSNLFDKQYFSSGTFGSAPDDAFVPMSELGDSGSGTIQGIDDSRFVMPGEDRLWTLMLKLAF